MALVKHATRRSPNKKCVVHEAVECEYFVFEQGGQRYIQLETKGSPRRAKAGVPNQILQFSESSFLGLFNKCLEGEIKAKLIAP